ncbi:hypothetical protein GCM10027033_22360 [Leucobacter ruminantium]
MSTKLPERATTPDPSPVDRDGETATAAAPRPKPKAWVRLVALLAALFTAWHVLASFLWIAPYSENAREIVPGSQDTLTAYMIPFFGQSWSVFAPEPINGDYHFNVRATLADGSETGWVSATDVELSMIQYNLFPPRAGIQSSEVASSYKDAYDSVDELQRTVVGGDFAVDDWEGLRAALETPQKAADEEAGEGDADPSPAVDNTAEIEQLLAEEHRTTAYATQVARAIWGDEVEKVQFRVSRQNIIPFAQRHDPQAQRPEPTVVLPGWPAPIVEEGQNEGNFADVFRGQFERITR